jgi:hypothetical protein
MGLALSLEFFGTIFAGTNLAKFRIANNFGFSEMA